MSELTPLEIARRIEASARNPETGDLPRDGLLYVADSTVPPTLLTVPQYESGMKVLRMRYQDKADR